MGENLRICRKCLLDQETEEEFREKLQGYIDHLAEEDRVDQKTYENRLSICGRCEYLTKGMCRLCGCYVELRAAMKIRKCPDSKRQW